MCTESESTIKKRHRDWDIDPSVYDHRRGQSGHRILEITYWLQKYFHLSHSLCFYRDPSGVSEGWLRSPLQVSISQSGNNSLKSAKVFECWRSSLSFFIFIFSRLYIYRTYKRPKTRTGFLIIFKFSYQL